LEKYTTNEGLIDEYIVEVVQRVDHDANKKGNNEGYCSLWKRSSLFHHTICPAQIKDVK
jgi:hypothetical protein